MIPPNSHGAVQCTPAFETGPRLHSRKELASDDPSPHVVSKSQPSLHHSGSDRKPSTAKAAKVRQFVPFSTHSAHQHTTQRCPQRHWSKVPSTNGAQKSKEPFILSLMLLSVRWRAGASHSFWDTMRTP